MYAIPLDGIADGGEVYTEEELEIINKENEEHMESTSFMGKRLIIRSLT